MINRKTTWRKTKLASIAVITCAAIVISDPYGNLEGRLRGDSLLHCCELLAGAVIFCTLLAIVMACGFEVLRQLVEVFEVPKIFDD
jgi:hypothetical protein